MKNGKSFKITGSKPLEGYQVDDLKSKLCSGLAACIGAEAETMKKKYGVYPPDVVTSALLLAVSLLVNRVNVAERKELRLRQEMKWLLRKYERLLEKKGETQCLNIEEE